MILKALYDLAIVENLVPDPDFEIKPVSWVVRVGDNGLFLGIEKLSTEVPKSIPKRLTSRQGKHPPAEFFVDNPLYVLGKSIPAGKYDAQVCKKRRLMFAARVVLCGFRTKDLATRSVGFFLRNINRGVVHLDIPSDMKGNDLISFSYQMEDIAVHERPDVVEYWRKINSNGCASKTYSVCLVSGELCNPASKHKKLKNVPQKKISDIALASCNQSAFESYGWQKNENAVIGERSSDYAMTALNRLLHPNPPDPTDPNLVLSRQNTHLSADTVACYWTKRDRALSASFGLAIEVDEAKMEAAPAQVAAMYKSIWKGIPYTLDKPDEFYSLVLSGGQGRATVRDWFEFNTQYVVDSLAQYFCDLKVVRCCPAPKKGKHPESFPLPILLEALADPKEQRKEGIPSTLGTQFYRASIDKRRMFPQPAFYRAIVRYRAELPKENDENKGWLVKNWNDARASIIKAYLNRKQRNSSINDEVSEKMNPICNDKGYLLGQLMSVLEKLQNEALGDVNASIVDRYFAGASSSPKSVFSSLLRNARNHARKAKEQSDNKGIVFNLEKLIDQICGQFEISLQDPVNPKLIYENGFPTYLSLEQQGMFVLGYHQMRKWLWMTRVERDSWNAEHVSAPSAYIWKKKTAEIENVTDNKGAEQ